MKKMEVLKLLFTKKHTMKPDIVQKKLFYNNVELKKIFVNFCPYPKKMYKIIRNVKVTKNANVFYARNQKAFNTYLFKSNYDVVVADKNGKILKTHAKCKPNFISKYRKDGWYVFFFPIGFIFYYDFQKNNLLTPGIKILKDIHHASRF